MRPARALTMGFAACALAASRIWLRTAPGRAVRWAAGDLHARPSSRALLTPVRMASAIRAVGIRTHASCLEQGLALVMLLTITRIPARLVIGVSRLDGAIAAHAWVEYQGRIVLGEPQAVDFVPLPTAAPLPCRG